MPVNDPEAQIQADADELEERLGKLDDHIDEARKKVAARGGDAEPGEDDDAGGDTGDFDDPEAEEEEEDE